MRDKETSANEPLLKYRNMVRWHRNRGLIVAPGQVWKKPVYWPGGVWYRGGVNLSSGFCMERGNLSLRCEGINPRGSPLEDESTDAEHRGGAACSSEESSVMEPEQRGCTVRF